MFVKIKSFATEEEAIIAVDELTRQSVTSHYVFNGDRFVLKVVPTEWDTAINLIANSISLKDARFQNRDDEVA
ncbi:MAG: hypothetical protein HRU19_15760 [Pseudobacteriovorax sp.]|nr:hypothetical protein [Pseudobacteriovorax sp.]